MACHLYVKKWEKGKENAKLGKKLTPEEKMAVDFGFLRTFYRGSIYGFSCLNLEINKYNVANFRRAYRMNMMKASYQKFQTLTLSIIHLMPTFGAVLYTTIHYTQMLSNLHQTHRNRCNYIFSPWMFLPTFLKKGGL